MALNGDTGITHSEMLPDGQVKACIETSDEEDNYYTNAIKANKPNRKAGEEGV